MKLTLTKTEADAVQYMVWCFSSKQVPEYKQGLEYNNFSIQRLSKLWSKIVNQIGEIS